MFSHRFFAASYYGPHYFGPGSEVIVVPPTQEQPSSDPGGRPFVFFEHKRPTEKVRVNARAPGAILKLQIELRAGSARGDAKATGQKLPFSTGLRAGNAHAGAKAPGDVIQTSPELAPGAGRGSATALGSKRVRLFSEVLAEVDLVILLDS